MTQPLSPRLQREYTTFLAMQRIYCSGTHPGQKLTGKGELCSECADLSAYALARLQKCPYQDRKPACANCPIHCYRKDMRARVREMMRFAGPRMLLRHPVLAVLHLLDGLKKAPDLSR